MDKVEIIQNHQLMYAKFDIITLERNIDRLSLRNLLRTQILTPDFCVKYLLNPEEHGMCVEDHYISKQDIILYQPHITMQSLEVSTTLDHVTK
jgi:hypothetical protein